MPFVPIANTAKVTLQYRLSGQITQNVLHFEYVSSPGTPELNNLAADLVTWYSANIKPLVTEYLTLDKIIAADQTSQNAEAIEYTTSQQGAITTASSPALPNHCAVAVKHVTGLRGRSYRGRTYHMGLVENQVALNNIETAFQASLDAAYTALVTYPWTDIGWIWVVASRFSNNAPRAAGVTTPIISVSVDQVIDSQRRRLPGRGA